MAELRRRTCDNLRLVLSTCPSTGLPAEQLCCDYRNKTGTGIPFRQLGFDSLGALLTSEPSICKVTRLPSGGLLVFPEGKRRTVDQQTEARQQRVDRKLLKPKQPARRPKQHSTAWVPPAPSGGKLGPSCGDHTKLRREGSTLWKEGSTLRRENSALRREGSTLQGRGRGGFIQQDNNRKPLREPKRKEQEFYTPVKRTLSNNQQQSNQQQSTRRNFKEELEAHFSLNHMGSIPYKTASIGKDRYMATLSYEGDQYKTYPQTYSTQIEAEEALAKIIVNKLGLSEVKNPVKTIKVTKDNLVYAERVVKILGDRNNGVWSSQIENEYLQEFSEKLPNNWIEEVEALNQIRKECPVPDSIRFIVYSVSPDFRANLPPPLGFPTEEIWDVFVTIVRSTLDVNIRIIGDGFSGNFDNLLSDMDLHYFEKNSEADVPEPKVGGIYAAQVSSDWHRVRVEESFENHCVCYFIDHGDTDIIQIEDLRAINLKFLLLPPQVIKIQLAGLEDYKDSETVLNHMNQYLLGKSLVAKVENRDTIGTRFSKEATIPPRLIFFDTSSEKEDVNINKRLIEIKVREDSQSKLPSPGGEEIQVILSSISENGDIYVDKRSNDFLSKNQVEDGDISSLPNGNFSNKESIKCRLSGVPPEGHSWSPMATAALWDLVAEDQVVTLRVISLESNCPMVELNLLDSNEGSINFDLSTEFDIFPLAPMEINKNDNNNNNYRGEEDETSLSNEKSSTSSSPHSSLSGNFLSLPYPLMPEIGTFLDLTVTFAVSPANFVIQLHNKGEGLDKLQQEMAEHFGHGSVDQSEESCSDQSDGSSFDQSEERYFAVSQNDGLWHRIEVTTFLPGGQAAVRFIDQGRAAMLDICQLTSLPSQFRRLPRQALPASLSSVDPVSGDWSPEDNYWFNNRVAGKQFVGQVKGVVEGERLVLDLVDTSHPSEDVYIHLQLLEEKRAILRES